MVSKLLDPFLRPYWTNLKCQNIFIASSFIDNLCQIYLSNFFNFSDHLLNVSYYFQDVVVELRRIENRFHLLLDSGERLVCNQVLLATGAYINISDILQVFSNHTRVFYSPGIEGMMGYMFVC